MPIIINREDGGVSIMVLLEGTDVAAEVAKWESSGGGKAVSWREVKESELPQDRTFRAAWRDNTSRIEPDMAHCRGIWRDRMRAARAPKLAALDVEAVCAMEIGSDLKQIAAAKQTLRDVTKDPAIAAAMTPDDLKKVWPVELQ